MAHDLNISAINSATATHLSLFKPSNHWTKIQQDSFLKFTDLYHWSRTRWYWQELRAKSLLLRPQLNNTQPTYPFLLRPQLDNTQPTYPLSTTDRARKWRQMATGQRSIVFYRKRVSGTRREDASISWNCVYFHEQKGCNSWNRMTSWLGQYKADVDKCGFHLIKTVANRCQANRSQSANALA